MWQRNSESDIIDFALLWEPLGGPGPENIESAFSIDSMQYASLLQAAARIQLARLRDGLVCPERIYGLSAIAALDRDPRKMTA